MSDYCSYCQAKYLKEERDNTLKRQLVALNAAKYGISQEETQKKARLEFRARMKERAKQAPKVQGTEDKVEVTEDKVDEKVNEEVVNEANEKEKEEMN